MRQQHRSHLFGVGLELGLLSRSAPRGPANPDANIRNDRPGFPASTTTRSAKHTASPTSWVTNSTVGFWASHIRLEVALQLLAGQRIQRAEWLVHQQQARVVDQSAAQRNPLLLPTGKLPWISIAVTREADPFEQVTQRGGAVRGAAEAAHARLKRYVAKDRSPLEQDRLLKDDAQVLDRPGYALTLVDRLSPCEGNMRPPTIFISVVFPQPLMPTNATNSPARISS